MSLSFILAALLAIASFRFIRRTWLAASVALLVSLPVVAIISRGGVEFLIADLAIILLVGAASVYLRSLTRKKRRAGWATRADSLQAKSQTAPEPETANPAAAGQNVRIGNVLFTLQQDHAPAIELGPYEPGAQSPPITTERPEMLVPAEEPQYIYRTSDAFQSAIDQAHAVASINTTHRPWVRITWFILFIIGPLVYVELFALATALRGPETEAWKTFLIVNAVVFPSWLIYFSIWWRKARRTGKRAKVSGPR